MRKVTRFAVSKYFTFRPQIIWLARSKARCITDMAGIMLTSRRLWCSVYYHPRSSSRSLLLILILKIRNNMWSMINLFIGKFTEIYLKVNYINGLGSAYPNIPKYEIPKYEIPKFIPTSPFSNNFSKVQINFKSREFEGSSR